MISEPWFSWLLCWWFSYFTVGYEHLWMEYQETKIQSRKNKTAFISQLAETSSELKIPWLWVKWQCRLTDKKSILQTQRRRFFPFHSVLGQLCCCSLCLHLELSLSHSPKHLSWVTDWKWSYCLLLCPVERLIDRWDICQTHLFFFSCLKIIQRTFNRHWFSKEK